MKSAASPPRADRKGLSRRHAGFAPAWESGERLAEEGRLGRGKAAPGMQAASLPNKGSSALSRGEGGGADDV